MRIAILGSRGYPSTYGGFETLVRRLAPYLQGAGHDVWVYCRERDGHRPWSRDRLDGVTRVFTPGIDRKSASTLTYGMTSSIDCLWRHHEAVIVLNVANGFFLPLIRRTGALTVVNVDGLEWQRSKWNGVGRTVFRLGALATARYASHIVTDSRAMASTWESVLGRQSTFIPYGADIVGSRPTCRIERLGLTPEGYYLVVARLSPENNVDLVLDAYDRLRDKRPLVVVGSANYENSVTKRLRSRSGTDVRWLGHVSDQDLLTDLWAHCAVYLHGHSVGGTNPALLQALGAGSPTLALDTPFNREVLQSDDQLFGRSPADLAQMMAALADDDARRTDIHRQGRARIEEGYSWDAVCRSYLALCREELGRQPGCVRVGKQPPHRQHRSL